MALAERRGHGRSMYLAGQGITQGITQYLDLGAGLPTSPAVHETARTREDRAAVAYLDNDAVGPPGADAG